MRAVCALGALMSAFALLALGGRVLGCRVLGSRVLGSRVLGSRWRSGLGRAPTTGMHRGSAPARRSGVAAVLALVAVLRQRRCAGRGRSEEHTSELQSQSKLVCRFLLGKKKTERNNVFTRKLPYLIQ